MTVATFETIVDGLMVKRNLGNRLVRAIEAAHRSEVNIPRKATEAIEVAISVLTTDAIEGSALAVMAAADLLRTGIPLTATMASHSSPVPVTQAGVITRLRAALR